MAQWHNFFCFVGLLMLAGCTGRMVSWLEEPTSFGEKVRQMREEYTQSEPIVESNARQRLSWRI